MKVFKSSFSRVELSEGIVGLAAGINKSDASSVVSIPRDVLKPRQVKLLPSAANVPARLKYHRDGYVPVIGRFVAENLVLNDQAEFCSQSALFYSVDKYLGDPDVIADADEVQRVLEADPDVVFVGVIGDNRSALSVCRNIVSGCQNPFSLKDDAAGAVEAASIFLVEDDQ